MSMPSELRELLEELKKWQYQVENGNWFNFIVDIKNFDGCEFRLKKEKPLTVEEALKLEEIYVPYVHISLTKGIISAEYFDITKPSNIENYAKLGLAYRTPEGAIAHAQMWLDMEVEE